LEAQVKLSEKRWIVALALVLAVITTIPYVFGYLSEGDSWRFTGFVYGVEDGNSYLAKMQNGTAGDWLFRTPYSAEPQSGVLAFLPYILLGKLAGGTAIHTQLVVLYHLFRVVSIPLTLYAIYSLSSIFTKKIFWRRWITTLASVGGGFGWVFLLFGVEQIAGSLPLEWFSPEWFGFLSFYGQPHLLLARALLLLGLTRYLCSPYRTLNAWKAGFIFLSLGLVHPLSLVSASAAIAFHLLGVFILAGAKKTWAIALRWLKRTIIALLIPAPLVLYTVIKFSIDPFLKQWTAQNRIFSPDPVHILIAYGLMVPFVIIGIKPLLKSRRWSGLLPVMWMIALPLLAYAPHNLQRRLPEGIWVVILIIAGKGLVVVTKASLRREKLLGYALFALTIPTSIMLIIGGIRVSRSPSLPVFRPSEEVEVFEWLNQESTPHDIVLSSFETGNALPAWAPLRVVVGHGPESVNIDQALTLVGQYYSGEMSDEQSLEFLARFEVDYVFLGPQEDAIAEPRGANVIYQSGDYQLYQVERP
jgi:hypothetical protein